MPNNPVSRWINNTMDASVKVDAAGEKYRASSKIVEDLSKKKNLSAREKDLLDSAKQSLEEAKKEVPDARGQFFGSLLQNRKYDSQGKVVGTQPNHHVTDSKNNTKTVK